MPWVRATPFRIDILGFSLGYEMALSNVLNVLDLAVSHSMPRAHGLTPLIIAGGTACFNAEPLAGIYRLFFAWAKGKM